MTPEDAREKKRISQQERRKQGLCNSCGNPAVDGKTRCQVHLDLAAEQTRERNKQRAELGVCTRCKRKPAKPEKRYCQACLDYCNAKTKAAYKIDPSVQQAASQKYYQKRKAKGICPQCNERPADEGRTCCGVCRQYHAKSGARRQEERRRVVFGHYGTSCKCCGESHVKFLQIDHIDGGGRKHLTEIGQSSLYAWLIKHDFPRGFQTLCAGCNFAWGHNRCCPHAEDRLVSATVDGVKVMRDPQTSKIVASR